MGDLPRLLTLSDVCEVLRISLRQGWRMLSAGQLPEADVSLGGVRGRRWRSDHLGRWIDAGCPPVSAWQAMRGCNAPSEQSQVNRV